MSAEDLENYETEMELALYREYRDVVHLFSHVVETDRRFYLCNQVDVKARTEAGDASAPAFNGLSAAPAAAPGGRRPPLFRHPNRAPRCRENRKCLQLPAMRPPGKPFPRLPHCLPAMMRASGGDDAASGR